MKSFRSRRARKLGTVAMALLIIAGVSFGFVYREFRRLRLNRDLILALESQHEDDAIALLHQGAEGTARERDAANRPSLHQVIVRLLDGVLNRSNSPQSQDGENRGALLLYYDTAPNPDVLPDSRSVANHEPKESLILSLLDAGASRDETDSAGQTPIYLASRLHHHAAVRRLVATGVRLSILTGVEGETPLMAADAEDAKVLLEHGAEVDQTGQVDGHDSTNTALIGANAAKTGILLDHGAKINKIDFEGQTPLYFACFMGDNATVQVLLAHHANPAIRDPRNLTALLRAASACSLETVQALVRAGADIHARGWWGSSALMFAVDNQDSRVFYWVIKQGVDINLLRYSGAAALDVAEQRRAEISGKRYYSGGRVLIVDPRRAAAHRAEELARLDAIIQTLRCKGAKQVKHAGEWFYPEDP